MFISKKNVVKTTKVNVKITYRMLFMEQLTLRSLAALLIE
jgi:hypothetical protein